MNGMTDTEMITSFLTLGFMAGILVGLISGFFIALVARVIELKKDNSCKTN